MPAQHSRTTVTNLVELVCRGGWPGMIGAATNDAQRFVRDYLEEIRRTDFRRVDGIRRNPVLVRRVLQSLARNVATEAAVSVIAADAGEMRAPCTRRPFRAIRSYRSGSCLMGPDSALQNERSVATFAANTTHRIASQTGNYGVRSLQSQGRLVRPCTFV